MIGYMRARSAAKRARRQYEAQHLALLLETLREENARREAESKVCRACLAQGAPHEFCEGEVVNSGD